VVLDSVVGGATLGKIQTVNVTILANAGVSTKGEVTEMKVRVLNTTTQFPPSSSVLQTYLETFREDIAGKLSIPIARVVMVDSEIDTFNEGKLIMVFDFLSSTNPSDLQPNALASSLIQLIGNPQSIIYQGKVTRWIDITFMPQVSTHSDTDHGTPVPSGDPLTIFIIILVVIVFILLVLCAIAYIKRKPLMEWTLWKLAGFRFTRFADEREDSNHLPGSPGVDLGGKVLDGNILDSNDPTFDAEPTSPHTQHEPEITTLVDNNNRQIQGIRTQEDVS